MRTSEIGGGTGETKGVIGTSSEERSVRSNFRGRARRTVVELDWTLAWFWILIVNVQLEGLTERMRE